MSLTTPKAEELLVKWAKKMSDKAITLLVFITLAVVMGILVIVFDRWRGK